VLREPVPEGITADGGWRARRGVPSAGTISGGAVVAGVGAAVLLGFALTARRR
jgi:hypothetical protein